MKRGRLAPLEKVLPAAQEIDMTEHHDLESELQVSLHVNDQLRARIAELEDELAGWHKSQSRFYDKLHARIAELEAALRPFVSAADLADDLDIPAMNIRSSDLRAARAALDKTPEDWSHKNDGWR